MQQKRAFRPFLYDVIYLEDLVFGISRESYFQIFEISGITLVIYITYFFGNLLDRVVGSEKQFFEVSMR